MSLRSLWRRAYGVRNRILHERNGIWGDAEKLDGETFCWTGGIGNRRVTIRPDDDPDLAVVDILAKKCMEVGGFNLDLMRAEYKRLTSIPEDPDDGLPER